MVNTNLIYLSYGNEFEYRRTLFSVLSFFSWCEAAVDSTRIIIYTDKPDFFRPYLFDKMLEFYFLSPALLEQMKGKDHFIHRIKVSIIDLAFQNYPNENQLFIDSDTFFTADATQLINEIRPGRSIMHVREYAIEESLDMFASYNQGQFPKAFMQYITNRAFKVGKEMISFSNRDFSWNSGVLGLHKDFAIYMADVLNLTDRFYGHSSWFISEQLAFSFILQRKTEIQAADAYIYHYWGKRQKNLIDMMLVDYFIRSNTTALNNKNSLRIMTRNYKKAIKNDLILEQVEIAIDYKSWGYALKKCVQFILINQFNFKVCIKLYSTLKYKINCTTAMNGIV
jgi:hypothetical protein